MSDKEIIQEFLENFEGCITFDNLIDYFLEHVSSKQLSNLFKHYLNNKKFGDVDDIREIIPGMDLNDLTDIIQEYSLKNNKLLNIIKLYNKINNISVSEKIIEDKDKMIKSLDKLYKKLDKYHSKYLNSTNELINETEENFEGYDFLYGLKINVPKEYEKVYDILDSALEDFCENLEKSWKNSGFKCMYYDYEFLFYVKK